MNYEEFKKKVVAELPGYFAGELEGKEIEIRYYPGTNRWIEAFVIKGERIGPAYHAEPLFLELQKTGESWEECMKHLAVGMAEHHLESKRIISGGLKFDNHKKIFPMLINAEKNREFILNAPHDIRDDLAIIYGYMVEGGGHVKIDNKLMKYMGLTKGGLCGCWMQNRDVAEFQPVCKRMDEILREQEGMKEEELEGIPERPELYVLTNRMRYYGAAVICDGKILKELANETGADLYIFPCSVHEVIACPDRGELDEAELRQMVRDANSTGLEEDEFLSDNLYIYRRDMGRVEILEVNG